MSLTQLISKSLRNGSNVFDTLMIEFQSHFERGATSISELRSKVSTKERGDLWEEFCCLYLVHVKGYDNVWMLKDVPEDILIRMNLGRRDIGIDIIVQKGDTLSCVQCKYRKNGGMGYKRKGSVSWKELSTFYALASRTGPWHRYIVMTNCSYISHNGLKGEKDRSICKRSFQSITFDQWRSMIGYTGRTLIDTPTLTVLPIEQVREARLKYLERFNK